MAQIPLARLPHISSTTSHLPPAMPHIPLARLPHISSIRSQRVRGPRQSGSSSSGLCRAAAMRSLTAGSSIIGTLPEAASTTAALFSQLSSLVYSTSLPPVCKTTAAFGAWLQAPACKFAFLTSAYNRTTFHECMCALTQLHASA